nr:hypothetical protein [Tanacetum cinerariifolium]
MAMAPTSVSSKLCSGLVPNPPSSTPFVPPSRTDWDLLFQPLFNELFTPPPSVDHPTPKVITPNTKVVAQEPAASIGSPSSTTVGQDAPSPSNSQTTPNTQTPVISNDVEEDNHDLDVDICITIRSSSNMRQTYTPFESVGRWTKDHLEPKSFKQAMTESLWIDAMQEEIHEFERLEVWELVPCPNKVLLIKLKWIYKVKTDEFGRVLKNKGRLNNPSHVYKLKKALYGLKQAPRACDYVDTPLVEKSKLDEDLQGNPIYATLYHGMIGSVMYLTFSRPDLTYAVCLCAWYQEKPTEKHLNVVKQIFQNLKKTINMGLIMEALDDELVAPTNRLKIGKLNLRLSSSLNSKEPTLQVVTVSTHHSSLCFKMNSKSHTMNVDNFREMLQICPKLPGQKFEILQLKRKFFLLLESLVTLKSSDDEDNDDADDQSDDEDDDDGDSQGDDDQDDDNEQTESDNVSDDFLHPKLSTFDKKERHDQKQDEEKEVSYLRVQTPSYFESIDDEAYDDVTQGINIEEEKLDEVMTNKEEVDELYDDVNINLEGRGTEITDESLTNVQATQVIEDTHVIMTDVTPEAQQQSSSISSGFISNMLNPNPDIDRLKALEDDFFVFKQTNLFAKTVSSIPDIVDMYLANKMNKAVKTAIQLQLDRLRDEAQAENEDFINKIDENIKKIIKEQVKVQVKEKVSKILPRIKKLVNDQLESEVLTRSSNEDKTSHVVAANLSKLELKKILIDKIESNKSINRSVQQKTLYKSLIDAYETDKVILDIYGDTVMIKRHRGDEDNDEEPFARSNRGSKIRRARKELDYTSEPKEKTSKLTRKSTKGSKSHQKSTDKST